MAGHGLQQPTRSPGGGPTRRGLLRLAAAAGAVAAAGTAGPAFGHGKDSALPRASKGRPPVTGPLAGQDFARLPISEKKVALTFDCGSSPDGVDKVLTALEAHAVPATFFMTGRFASDHADAARRIGRAYPVGNHSMTHPEFPRLTHDERVRELRAADRSVAGAIGRAPAPLFRFPFGAVDRQCIDEVNAEGYVCVRWTVDTVGWKGAAAGATTDTVIARVMQALTPGAIILMHVGRTSTADPSTVDATALPQLIEAINDQGYGYTSLGTLIG
ncbi:polysaccharide deacetylase family protein [Streptomyces cinnamoneus]|uniref:polysaccharide deacetylase family protein n=1 Tax=Streptomyces cinnamoneus TaxID=53446 RepID=UPI0033C5DDE8